MAPDPIGRHSQSPYCHGYLVDYAPHGGRRRQSNLPRWPKDHSSIWFIHRHYSPAEPRWTYEH
ncbi:hypothetical protein FYJ43_08210 [Cutibacterium sp. WCA-380-WT-3A]|uniref:Uncharacterized protein n=1 Tax=Cutibacterium porci TaxID=2605781 RepID=A0A7K0J7T2_9ACTN|nr:hypothetical protein [Cutibacterium porci]